jgi:chemotaxis protein CheX
MAHVDCVREAAVESLATTCGITPELKADEPPPTGTGSNALVAVISLVGGVEWTLTIDLPQPVASALSAKFAGFEIPFESSDMGDAIGEVANIVAGTTKAKLDQKGVKADISLPTVLRGNRMEVLKCTSLPSVRFTFASPFGTFWVGVVAGSNVVSLRKTGA